jgi:4-hydroxy-tetrahydrodipicolinate synthase
MGETTTLRGVFAAALTPLKSDFSLDADHYLRYLHFLAERGCHGALLMGTTGEGPSFSPSSRLTLLRAAMEVRQVYPDFRLLLGTGTPSLDETVHLTKEAFDAGADGVVVLPPYYFRKAPRDGLIAWFSEVLRKAVPEGGAFLAYHIPGVSGVPLTLDLLAQLKDSFPTRFTGLKDSSGDPSHAQALGKRFGDSLLVLNGNDRLFSHALSNQSGGCITAMASLFSPDLRCVWDSYQSGTPNQEAQTRLDRARMVLDQYAPVPPILKALLFRKYSFPYWPPCPPLLPSANEDVERCHTELFANS